MAYLLDTSVAIVLRDSDPDFAARIDALGPEIFISVISRVELEGGVYRELAYAPLRRARLDALLASVPILSFDQASADAYATILEASGFSRRKIIDRMIAAQALVHDATLVTLNPADFSDIPGLKLLAW